MQSHGDVLERLVEGFLTGALPFGGFEAQLTAQMLDRIPDDALTEREWEYYDAIREKTEWTGSSPTPEERSYGWIDENEFREWLRGFVRNRP